jgi:hypothetical protein
MILLKLLDCIDISTSMLPHIADGRFPKSFVLEFSIEQINTDMLELILNGPIRLLGQKNSDSDVCVQCALGETAKIMKNMTPLLTITYSVQEY